MRLLADIGGGVALVGGSQPNHSSRGRRGGNRGTRGRGRGGGRGGGGAVWAVEARPPSGLRTSSEDHNTERGPSPIAREWKDLGEGAMMVSLEFEGHIYKGALTRQHLEV